VLAPLNARWSSAEAARSLLRCGGAAVLLLHPDATLDCGALVAQGAVGRILLLHGQPHAGMDGDAWRPHPHRLCASDLVPSPDGTAVVCFTSGKEKKSASRVDETVTPSSEATHVAMKVLRPCGGHAQAPPARRRVPH
jgi:hypothetical protein